MSGMSHGWIGARALQLKRRSKRFAAHGAGGGGGHSNPGSTPTSPLSPSTHRRNGYEPLESPADIQIQVCMCVCVCVCVCACVCVRACVCVCVFHKFKANRIRAKQVPASACFPSHTYNHPNNGNARDKTGIQVTSCHLTEPLSSCADNRTRRE